MIIHNMYQVRTWVLEINCLGSNTNLETLISHMIWGKLGKSLSGLNCLIDKMKTMIAPFCEYQNEIQFLKACTYIHRT